MCTFLAENDRSNSPLTFCENRMSGENLVFDKKGYLGKIAQKLNFLCFDKNLKPLMCTFLLKMIDLMVL